jgi:dihydrofolate synthase / folylpolyglutamate synthase
MNYQETIEYLYARLPMFSKVGSAAYKPDLSNTLALCATLDNPHQKIKTIHIAGTNGKGSVSHMLAAILQTAGYKTGLYTSPHLKDFRERIKIDGQMVSKQFVIDFTQHIQPHIAALEPSFFELTVAMAFDYFAKEQVDIAVIETGLGGRLDSTNIITPELSIITNIGWDHMNILGDTLQKIAIEKAGIIKPGIPVIVGEIQTETKEVFERIAKANHSSLYFASTCYSILQTGWKDNKLHTAVSNRWHQQTNYQLELSGIYQTKNLITILQSLFVLQEKGWDITDVHIQKGLANTKQLTGLHGRWEIIHQQPMVVLDVAHNVSGMEQLLLQIAHTPHKKLHLIVGMVKDKDVDKVLALLPTTANYYFTQASIPRAMPAMELKQKAAAYGLEGTHFESVNFCLFSAMQKADKEDIIIVCGSVFLVGEVSVSAIKEMGIFEDNSWLHTTAFFNEADI